MDPKTQFLIFAALVWIVLFFGCVAFCLLVTRPWLRAFLGGCYVSLLEIIGMRLRGTLPGLIIDACLALRHRGVRASVRVVESTYLAHKGQDLGPSELADLVEQRVQQDKKAA